MEFIQIPPGKIRMEGNVVGVKPFMMAKAPVTRRVWRDVMGTAPWEIEGWTRGGADYPATYVSWDNAQEFCRKTDLSLPSEVQWQCAYKYLSVLPDAPLIGVPHAYPMWEWCADEWRVWQKVTSCQPWQEMVISPQRDAKGRPIEKWVRPKFVTTQRPLTRYVFGRFERIAWEKNSSGGGGFRVCKPSP